MKHSQPFCPDIPGIPRPPLRRPPAYAGPFPPAPDDGACTALWDRYGMLPNIRKHSLLVARVTTFLADRACALGLAVDRAEARASALLHDLAKTFTIRHGGNHSQLGAAWVMEHTGHARVAQGVAHHVYWPFEADLLAHFTPLAVLYGDNRVAHDAIVSMEDRFADLMDRYGKTELIRLRIQATLAQGRAVEALFSQLLQVDLSCACF